MEPLPPRLEALLATESDADFIGHVRAVAHAAARTISQLGELDLIQYEEPDVDASADLGMWEEVAPFIASTLSEVNTLIAQIDASFPEGAILTDARHLEIERIVREVGAELRSEVMGAGMRLRDPSVVGDRWNLITAVQILRFSLRDRIGKMVSDVAQVYGDCKRREVEPGYEETLASTLVVRTMTADLRRLMRVRIHKVGDAAPDQMLQQAQMMERDLNAFGRTAAWRALRAPDKKGILEFRGALRRMIANGAPTKLEILELLEPFVDFVEAFSNINRRQILVEHDQEVLASVGVVLEQAMNTEGFDQRLAAFKQALDAGQTLYGRSGEFDTFLRAQRKGLPSADTLAPELEQFLVQIAGLSQY